jgi:cytochrome c peroxidase
LNANGNPNGPMMHNGGFVTLQNLIGHYGNINIALRNTNLDPRLVPRGIGQQLNFQPGEVDALIAFIKNTYWNYCLFRS